MPTLRRILKYTPAVALGLSVLLWVASCVTSLDINHGGRVSIGWGIGNVTFTRDGIGVDSVYVPFSFRISDEAGLHAGYFWQLHDGYRLLLLSVPVTWLITINVPLAIGPFISFRFRLWQYFAYTALVAVELAYYLQWQE